MLLAASIALGLWIWTAATFTVVALYVTATARRAAPGASRLDDKGWPAIAILRPCEGLDAELLENLLSSATARYDGPREVWLCVPSERDPSFAVAARARDQSARLAPGVRVEILVTAVETRGNRKAAQLAAGAARASAGASIVVVADSDVRLDDRSLPSLVAVLDDDPAAGAAWAPPVEGAFANANADANAGSGSAIARTFGDWASAAALSSTPHAFLTLAALSARTRRADVLCGQLMALRRETLDELGGFGALEPFLAEDFELARRLRAKGRTLAWSPAPVRTTDRGRTLGEALRRLRRWCVVVRRQRPRLYASYPLLLACTPLVVAAASALALVRAPFAPALAAAAAALALLRLALATVVRRRYSLSTAPWRVAAAALAGELMLLTAALSALGPPVIDWRGRRFRVGRDGRLTQLSSEIGG